MARRQQIADQVLMKRDVQFLLCERDGAFPRLHVKICAHRRAIGRCGGCRDYDLWFDHQSAWFDETLLDIFNQGYRHMWE